MPTTFDGEVAFLSALVGYQFRPGRLIVKLFAGIEAEDQHIVPHDPNNSVQGSELGLRLQEESWLDISPRLFSRLTLAMAQPSRNIARSLASAFASGRGGGFVRMSFRDTEFTLSGGFTGNYLEDEPSSYVALGVYRSF